MRRQQSRSETESSSAEDSNTHCELYHNLICICGGYFETLARRCPLHHNNDKRRRRRDARGRLFTRRHRQQQRPAAAAMSLAIHDPASSAPIPPMFVLLDCESGEEDDSLVYVYPRTRQCVERAGKTKGLLLALHGLMRSISGQAATTTSLDAKEGDGGGGVKVAYTPFEGGLMAVLLPSGGGGGGGGGLSDALAEAVGAEAASQLGFLHGGSEGWMGELRAARDARDAARRAGGPSAAAPEAWGGGGPRIGNVSNQEEADGGPGSATATNNNSAVAVAGAGMIGALDASLARILPSLSPPSAIVVPTSASSYVPTAAAVRWPRALFMLGAADAVECSTPNSSEAGPHTSPLVSCTLFKHFQCDASGGGFSRGFSDQTLSQNCSG